MKCTSIVSYVSYPRGECMRVSRFLPPGTSVTVNTLSIHRDQSNVSPHPAAFLPDCWLITSSSSSSGPTAPKWFVHNADEFISFALGPMNCVGKNLVPQGIQMIACTGMRPLHLRLREGWDAEEYRRGFKTYLVALRPVVPVAVSAMFRVVSCSASYRLPV